jgi:hypothetical protein
MLPFLSRRVQGAKWIALDCNSAKWEAKGTSLCFECNGAEETTSLFLQLKGISMGMPNVYRG